MQKVERMKMRRWTWLGREYSERYAIRKNGFLRPTACELRGGVLEARKMQRRNLYEEERRRF
uniref:Uncharacterized protein n=1 Tax=Hyaloperonospora arabidopsidis (strain Emoy2) TaxID=559515 RepID=M4BSU1_HYAAE